MSATFVVDCSVAMTWLFGDEATAETAALLDRLKNETAIVPSLWQLELTNVMAMAERKGRITPSQAAAFISDVGALDIEVDEEGPAKAFAELLPLCRAHHLTSYDAVYLELAMRTQLPLATLDVDLAKAAKKSGVKLLL
jgi:predicted nucleic acid-binding protein